ncbi:MAG: PHP domain-containing protein [Oscillospiraceae bacterium]|nr:PHP domain-containing protein [Oscillospiraceae bacterium]
MESKLYYDIHTHTVYSHGKGTIEDNAAAAEAAGLKLLGISDHGPGHIGFGLKMSELPNMRRDIDAAKEAHPGLDIRLGVEANIINASGRLDVAPEDLKLFDYIIAGYHFGVLGEAPFKSVATHIGGWWYNLTGRSSERNKIHNTDLVIKALEQNKIDIISHPGAKANFDIPAIAAAVSGTDTLLEINNRHGCLTVEGIRQAMEYDVKFILSSDAHIPGDVGAADEAISRAKEAGLDPGRVINLRKEYYWNL